MKIIEEFHDKASIILKFIGLLQSFLGTIGAIVVWVQSGNVLISVLCLFIALISIMLYIVSTNYLKKTDYLEFIEYLFNNDIHSFTLLPKLSLYLDQNGKTNKFHVKKLSVHYKVDAKPYKDGDNPYLGDMVAVFEYEIDKKKEIPQYYCICIGNDYATTPPIVELKYGIQTEYRPQEADELPRDVYIRSRVRCWHIKLEDNFITGKDILNLSLRISYKRGFDFALGTPDIIIFPPKAHAEHIDEAEYNIELNSFPITTDFRFACHAIERGKEGYETIDLSTGEITHKDEKQTKYKMTFNPEKDNVSHSWRENHKAYYFEIWDGSQKIMHQ